MKNRLHMDGCTFYAATLSKVASLGLLGRVSPSAHLQSTARKWGREIDNSHFIYWYNIPVS